MAFIPAANTVQVVAVYAWEGQGVINTLWFEHRSGAPTLPNIQDLALAFNEYWADTMMPLLSEAISYIGCVCTDFTSQTGPAVNQPIGSVAGGVSGPAVTNNTTFAIKFLTGGRGKSSRGRNFVPGLPLANVNNNFVDSALANALVDVYNGILGTVIDTGWAFSVVSFRSAGAPRSTALIQPIVGAGYSDLIVDSQRRRLPGRGT